MTTIELSSPRAGVAVITLERPDNRNSMTPELLDAFTAASARPFARRGSTLSGAIGKLNMPPFLTFSKSRPRQHTMPSAAARLKTPESWAAAYSPSE